MIEKNVEEKIIEELRIEISKQLQASGLAQRVFEKNPFVFSNHLPDKMDLNYRNLAVEIYGDTRKETTYTITMVRWSIPSKLTTLDGRKSTGMSIWRIEGFIEKVRIDVRYDTQTGVPLVETFPFQVPDEYQVQRY